MNARYRWLAAALAVALANPSQAAPAKAPPKSKAKPKGGAPADGPTYKTAVIRVYQTGDRFTDRVLLGTLNLTAKTPFRAKEDGAIPLDLRWPSKKPQLFGTVSLEVPKGMTATGFTRSVEPGYTLRNRSSRDRGGYGFAASNTPDNSLIGKGGAKNAQRIARMDVALAGQKGTYPLYLRYPKEPRQDWIYQQHSFRLSLELQVSNTVWKIEGPEVVHPAYEFPGDGGKTPAQLRAALIGEYGNQKMKVPLHPRDLMDCLDKSKAIGKALRDHSVAAAAFVNGQIGAKAGFSVTPLEIAVTLLTEGGLVVVRNGLAKKTAPDKLRFDGYDDLGIDSYATRWNKKEGSLRAFTHQMLKKYLEDPKKANIRTTSDEQNHSYSTFKTLTLEESAYAVAGLYAFFKERFANALANEAVIGKWTMKPADLPAHVQFFWSTYYFNTSSGRDRATPAIRDESLEFHDARWMLEDDHAKYKMNGKYNATWRTSTFRYHATRAGL